MQEAGFLGQKRRSPTALTLVVLAHAAALAALALAKTPEFIEAITKTKVTLIETDPPPPVEPPPPLPEPQRVFPEQVTTVPPVIDRTTLGPLVPPLPPVPPQPPRPPEQVAVRADPPGPRIVPPQRARASLSSYFSTDDYPAGGIRGNAEGTTRFSLTIGADGRVTNCTVTGSSGHAVLDSATCRILRSRARYTPARDQNGNPVSGQDRGSVTWRLPEE